MNTKPSFAKVLTLGNIPQMAQRFVFGSNTIFNSATAEQVEVPYIFAVVKPNSIREDPMGDDLDAVITLYPAIISPITDHKAYPYLIEERSGKVRQMIKVEYSRYPDRPVYTAAILQQRLVNRFVRIGKRVKGGVFCAPMHGCFDRYAGVFENMVELRRAYSEIAAQVQKIRYSDNPME